MKYLIRSLSLLGFGLFALAILLIDPSFRSPLYKAESGRLDLTEWSIAEDELIQIGGTWEVYEGVLLEPADFSDRLWPIRVPDGYAALNSVLGWEDKLTAAGGLWTYRLIIDIPEELPLLGLSFRGIPMASRIYLNYEFYGARGIAAEKTEGYERLPLPYEILYSAKIAKFLSLFR